MSRRPEAAPAARPHGSILSRRDFGRLAAAPLILGTSIRERAPHQVMEVDHGRVNGVLEDLQRYGGTGDGGTTRLAYSDEDLEARHYVATRLEEAGMTTRTDVAGNLIGRKEGRRDGDPIVIGSHIDTVPGGGSYDGQVGSAGAIEVALTLSERSVALDHPLEVMVFQNEEGGKTGSRALVGRVEPFELDIETASGYTIRDGIRRLGGDPGRLEDGRRPSGAIHAFLELHIEQGAVLDRDRIDIGVVEGIVGIRRWNIDVEGTVNHAGTTPMDQRRDALVAASELTVAINRIASSGSGRQVATVGRIEAHPGAPNVIPGRVRATLEIRDLSMERIGDVFGEITTAAAEIDGRRGVSTSFSRFYESLAAPTDPALRAIVEESAHALGYTTLRMPSGAGHDAQSMAEICPVGMVFVPSREGVSHSPDEWTSPESVTRGTNVLLHSVLALDVR